MVEKRGRQREWKKKSGAVRKRKKPLFSPPSKPRTPPRLRFCSPLSLFFSSSLKKLCSAPNPHSLVSGTRSLRLCSSSASHRCVLFHLRCRPLKLEPSASSEGAENGSAFFWPNSLSLALQEAPLLRRRSSIALFLSQKRRASASQPSLALCPEIFIRGR